MNSTKKTNNKISTKKFLSPVKKDSVWSSHNSIQFQVDKVIKKSGKIWIHYHLRESPKQTYFCYEEAFFKSFLSFGESLLK